MKGVLHFKRTDSIQFTDKNIVKKKEPCISFDLIFGSCGLVKCFSSAGLEDTTTFVGGTFWSLFLSLRDLSTVGDSIPVCRLKSEES